MPNHNIPSLPLSARDSGYTLSEIIGPLIFAAMVSIIGLIASDFYKPTPATLAPNDIYAAIHNYCRRFDGTHNRPDYH